MEAIVYAAKLKSKFYKPVYIRIAVCNHKKGSAAKAQIYLFSYIYKHMHTYVHMQIGKSLSKYICQILKNWSSKTKKKFFFKLKQIQGIENTYW